MSERPRERSHERADGARPDTDALVTLLQFSDGVFPAGGFAHSFGLETYAQAGLVRDRAGLEAFVTAHLEGSAGPCDAVAAAHAVRETSLAAWREIDGRLDAMKYVPEFRAASRQMGRQTVRVAVALGADPTLESLAAAIDSSDTPGHHALAFGAVTGRAGLAPVAVAAAFLYSTAALLVGAALRLLPLGQLDGQRTLAAVRPRVTALARRAAAARLDDMWSFTPGLERAGLAHARLEMRLFRS
jgi:urease accessory protein